MINPGLLNPDWWDLSKFVHNPDFHLGMDDFLPPDFDFSSIADYDESSLSPASSTHHDMDSAGPANISVPYENAAMAVDANPPKRLRLSLSRSTKVSVTSTNVCSASLKDSTNKPTNPKRFAKPVTSPEREKAAKGVIPVNTEASTGWAVRTFNAWALNRSFLHASEAVPDDLLESHDPELLSKWLCRFLLEARKSNGSPYPPASLRSLLCGLNRVLQKNKAPFSVLDKTNHRFRDLLKTLDSLSSDLHRQGVGAVKQSAKVIDPVHEGVFWQKGLLGYSPPKILQRTVFFYVGLNFVLRGVQEQYDLVPLQFTRVPEDTSVYDSSVYYEYVELVSKNNQHRFKDINARNKSVCAYALPGNERCIVKLLDTYLSYLPPSATHFYMRALEKFPSDPNKPCMTNQRVGINGLKGILPDLSAKSDIGVHYTNHSLRATAITRMFNSGIPEKVIAENSGHRSTKALRCYERTSQKQQQTVTSVVNNSENRDCKPCTSGDQVKDIDAPTESKPVMAVPTGNLGGFSGNFSNCTINISLK